MIEKPEKQEEDPNAGLPPFFKSWKQLYTVVIVELLFLIVVFYWFTKAFA